MTDNLGGTDTTTQPVTVTDPVQQFTSVADDFERTVSGGWGSAVTGGAWTRTNGAASAHSVDGHRGAMTMTAPGSTVSEYLNSVAALNLSGTVDVSLSALPTGGGIYAYVAVRHTAQGEYRFRVRMQATATTLQVTKMVTGTETLLAATTVAGLVYHSGDVLRVRFGVDGTGPTTLQGKVWTVGTTEPAPWQVNITDATVGLQSAGTFGLMGYLSSTTGTTGPLTVQFDNVSAS